MIISIVKITASDRTDRAWRIEWQAAFAADAGQASGTHGGLFRLRCWANYAVLVIPYRPIEQNL
jgi:hypothetical protein